MSSGDGSVMSELIKGDPTLKAEDFTETYIFGGHAGR
jgi:hypothetical protein